MERPESPPTFSVPQAPLEDGSEVIANRRHRSAASAPDGDDAGVVVVLRGGDVRGTFFSGARDKDPKGAAAAAAAVGTSAGVKEGEFPEEEPREERRHATKTKKGLKSVGSLFRKRSTRNGSGAAQPRLQSVTEEHEVEEEKKEAEDEVAAAIQRAVPAYGSPVRSQGSFSSGINLGKVQSDLVPNSEALFLPMDEGSTAITDEGTFTTAKAGTSGRGRLGGNDDQDDIFSILSEGDANGLPPLNPISEGARILPSATAVSSTKDMDKNLSKNPDASDAKDEGPNDGLEGGGTKVMKKKIGRFSKMVRRVSAKNIRRVKRVATKSGKTLPTGDEADDESEAAADIEGDIRSISCATASMTASVGESSGYFSTKYLILGEALRADTRIICACPESQETTNMKESAPMELPDLGKEASGAMSSALIKVSNAYQEQAGGDMTFSTLLTEMKTLLATEGLGQTPQISLSKEISVKDKFHFVRPGSSKKRGNTSRALLIGISYVGQDGELEGCHSDVLRMKQYIMSAHGFDENHIVVLMDDGKHILPTKENILRECEQLAENSKEGDSVICYYAGHYGKASANSEGKPDSLATNIFPLDYKEEGQIHDDDIFSSLICPMPADVTLTLLLDYYPRGAVLDLPYQFKAGSGMEEAMVSKGFDIDRYLAKVSCEDWMVGNDSFTCADSFIMSTQSSKSDSNPVLCALGLGYDTNMVLYGTPTKSDVLSKSTFASTPDTVADSDEDGDDDTVDDPVAMKMTIETNGGREGAGSRLESKSPVSISCVSSHVVSTFSHSDSFAVGEVGIEVELENASHC